MDTGILEQIAESLLRSAQALEGIERELQILRQHLLNQYSESEIESEGEDLDTVINDFQQEEKTKKGITFLLSWFERCGFEIVNYKVVPSQPEPLDWFAQFMGKRFHHLQPFYEQWKRAIHTRYPFTLNLADAPPEQISDTVQLAHQLMQAALVTNVRYRRDVRSLHVTPVYQPEVINFVTGGWLERFVGRLVWDIAQQQNALQEDIAVLRNIQILFPNRQQAELDLVIVYGERIIWLEGKTGDYSSSVERWQKVNQFLKLSPEEAALVLLNPPPSPAKEVLEDRTNMRVLGLKDLPSFLEQALSVK